MNDSQRNCKNQEHVHELTGSTRFLEECNDCHNHRFCTITGEAIYTQNQCDHYHEVQFRTDFSDGHYHEFCGKTGGAIDVGGGKHIHFIKSCTDEENGHNHDFQAATSIDSPTDFKCR